MRTKLRWLLALGAIVALALTVSACGDDDDDSTTASSERVGARASSRRRPRLRTTPRRAAT